MNELNLKDISKETTKGPTKVMVALKQKLTFEIFVTQS